MNAKRRRQIAKVVTQIEGIQTEVESILSDEQEYVDNMPESLQIGERLESAEYAIDHLEQVDGGLEEALEMLREAGA